MKCARRVSDHTGFHWWACGKPAKYRVWLGDGPAIPMCGIHKNMMNRKPGFQCSTLNATDNATDKSGAGQ